MLSFAFLFIFTAFQTSGNIETTTIGVFFSSGCNSSDTVPYGDDLGFYCLCVTYVCMGTFTLLAPPIIGLIGAKVTIVISGLFYIAIIPFLTRPLVGTLFLGSILAGAGGGVIWTAQGAILFSNSDNKTLGRNTGTVFSGYSFSPGEVNVCVEPGEAFSQEAATPGAQSRFSADISTECMYNREYEKG